MALPFMMLMKMISAPYYAFFYWNQSHSPNEFADIQRREVGMNWVNTIAVAANDGRAWCNDIGAIDLLRIL